MSSHQRPMADMMSGIKSLSVPLLLSELHLIRLPRLLLSQLHLYQIQRRGSLSEEPLQPADLQRGGFSLVCQLRHRLGALYTGGGLCLLLLGLQQTRRYPHVPRVC